MASTPPILNNKFYDYTKFIAQILLPALGTLYFGLASLWHLSHTTEVIGTITSVDTFLGIILGLSASAYNNGTGKYDGILSWMNTEDGTSTLHVSSIDPNAIASQQQVLFKVQQDSGVVTSAETPSTAPPPAPPQ